VSGRLIAEELPTTSRVRGTVARFLSTSRTRSSFGRRGVTRFTFHQRASTAATSECTLSRYSSTGKRSHATRRRLAFSSNTAMPHLSRLAASSDSRFFSSLLFSSLLFGGTGSAARLYSVGVWGKETRFTLATRNGGRSVAATLRVLRILGGCRGSPTRCWRGGGMRATMTFAREHLVVGQAADLLLGPSRACDRCDGCRRDGPRVAGRTHCRGSAWRLLTGSG
jgi:hypothetical protein